MQMFGVQQMLARQAVKSLLHRVVRFDLAGQHGVLEQFMKLLRQTLRLQGKRIELPPVRRQRGNGHAVLGQRAGLVDAQHGGLAKRFDGVEPACQHLLCGQAASCQRQEDDHDHRELLRQDSHGQRDPRQKCVEPSAAQNPIQQHEHEAQ